MEPKFVTSAPGQPLQVQKVQLIQSTAGGSVTSINGQPVTLLQIVQNTPKKRPAVDLSAHYNVVTVLPPQQPTKPNELATYHYLDESGQPFEKRQRVQRGGLRSCAKEVCDKVREKGRTTYTEVANEIVAETVSPTGDIDEKNIRRRVYDALNVLMALNIVHKEKNRERTISWVGLPTTNSNHDKSHFHSEKNSLQRKIRQKEIILRELLLQHVAFKRLIQRNKNSSSHSSVALPFICVSTSRDTEIDCSISEDQSEYHLKFNREFELHDDIQVLSRLGLTDSAGAEHLLPSKLRHFLHNTNNAITTNSASTSKSYQNQFKLITTPNEQIQPDMPQAPMRHSDHPPTSAGQEIVILTERDEQVQTIREAGSEETEVELVQIETNPEVKIEKNSVSRSLSFEYKMP